MFRNALPSSSKLHALVPHTVASNALKRSSPAFSSNYGSKVTCRTFSSPQLPQAGYANQQPFVSNHPTQSRRSLRPAIYAVAFLCLGLLTGKAIGALVVPPPLPEPDTQEDVAFTEILDRALDKVAEQVFIDSKFDKEDWEEYQAYVDSSPSFNAKSMTAGAMRGYRGLGTQKIFYNPKERRTITLLSFGGGLAGWPGVTHGGAVATLAIEAMEEATKELYGLSGSNGAKGQTLQQFKIDYKKPTRVHEIFVIDTRVDEQNIVRVRLLHQRTGTVCAEATGVFGPSDNNSEQR
jgi:hypothetical protein